MVNEATLLERIRNIFKDLQWCSTLYERTTPNQSPETFGQLLKTVASNYDDREKRKKTVPAATYTVDPPTQGTMSVMVANFFAKTRPPPSYRRPFRYQSRGYNHRFRGYGSHGDRSFGNYRNYGNRRYPGQRRLPFSITKRRCFGCKMEGHILRNCPEKHKYTSCLQKFRDIGTAAVMLLEAEAEEPTEEMAEVATYLADVEDNIFEAEDTSEFDAWICDLLEILDAEQEPSTPTHLTGYKDTYIIKESIEQLHSAMNEMMNHSVIGVFQHLLLDTGAPKSICSEPWLQSANWKPIKILSLPQNVKPFRFAGTSVPALHAACLIGKVTNTRGNTHILRQVVFVLPPTPIPFLVGLQTSRSHSFDICLRQGNSSHLKVNKWNNVFPLVINSHVWVNFEPCNRDPNPNFNWDELTSEAFTFAHTTTNFAYTVDSGPTTEIKRANDKKLIKTNEALQTHIVPPWERDNWKTKLTEKNVDHLHKVL